MNILEYNRNAWNLQSREGCRWSTPFSDEVFTQAKAGRWEVCLTPNRAVPQEWFPTELAGCELLCLASGGGQQAPILAAAGARVTSFDASDVQLEKDEHTATRHGLEIRTVQGDMADLSDFADACFDLVFNPVSTCFAADLTPIWRECFRILRPGGRLLTAFVNPAFYLFDHELAEETGELRVVHRLPYADLHDAPQGTLSQQLEAQVSLEFSHSLESQIGGQLQAGFTLRGMYEDDWDDESTALNPWMPCYIATRAEKPTDP